MAPTSLEKLSKTTTSKRSQIGQVRRREHGQSEQFPGEPAKEKLPSLAQLGLADLITLLNAVCGVGSIFLCLNYLENAHFEKYIIFAFILLPLGFLCDCLDGFVARNNYASPFGKDLDSLADLITFGVAPSCLGFTLGLRGIWDSFMMLVFVMCVMVRLARFNVTAKYIADEKGKVRYYEGLPSPASLLIVLLFFFAYFFDRVHDDSVWGGKYYIYPGHFHPLSVIYLAFAVLMVAQVKIKKL